MRLPVLAGLLLLAACASAPPKPIEVNASEAMRTDFLKRLQEALRVPDGEDADTVMNSLEHWLPEWQTQQRRGQAEPLEKLITVKVVCHFEDVLAALQKGTRERQLVAAWALGYARVPENDLGIASPHERARDALVAVLNEPDDALLRNALLGLWKLADPATPVHPLASLLAQHHDPDVRTNAALALVTVVTPDTVGGARDAMLVALADNEPRVRMHAAVFARRFPAPESTKRVMQLLPHEDTPLVRAAFARALGGAHAQDAVPELLDMLSSQIQIEADAAREALATIYGKDWGARRTDWPAQTT
jgi:HEAT repeat protein